jgi:hypothetical protein
MCLVSIKRQRFSLTALPFVLMCIFVLLSFSSKSSAVEVASLESYSETLPVGTLTENGDLQHVSGSPDNLGSTGQFGVDTTPIVGNRYTSFHTFGNGQRHESFSILLQNPLQAGQLVSFSYFARTLDSGARNWDNPGKIHIYGGLGFGIETELINISPTIPNNAAGWQSISFNYVVPSAITHLTFFNVSDAISEQFVGVDGFSVTIGSPSPDTDGDGIFDSIDIDDDNDGVLDANEGAGSTTITTSDSLIPNGDFNKNYVDANNQGIPYVGSEDSSNFTPPPWLKNSTPDLSTDENINFNASSFFSFPVARSALVGFGSSPAGGSFMGFRSFSSFATGTSQNEGLFNDFSVVDASEEITIRFYYTEYRAGVTTPGATDAGVNIVFRINATSSTNGSLIATIPNLSSLGGTNGTWVEQIITFTPSDFGINDGDTSQIYIGSQDSVENTWAFVDGLVVVTSDQIAGLDTDDDGISDKDDLDSDNDGISDLYESNGGLGNAVFDLNNDGTISIAEAESVLGVGSADVDGDGLMDIFDADTASIDPGLSVGTVELNSDIDDIPDRLDLDSDADGIPDAIEAQLTASYTGSFANDGDVRDDDIDNDGVLAAYDPNDGGAGTFGGAFNTPVDTNDDGTPDYLDDDSDGDGATDLAESGFTPGADADGDGIADNIAPNSYTDPDGIAHTGTGGTNIFGLDDSDNDTAADGADASPTAVDLDYRDVNVSDLTPVITLIPNVMVGITDFEVLVQVIELLDSDTSGTITVRIPKDSRLSVTAWDPSGTSLPTSGNLVNNAIWTFTEDATTMFFTADASIAGATQSNFGFSAQWSAGQTVGFYTASVVIVPGSGAEIRTNNNTDAEKASYSFQ